MPADRSATLAMLRARVVRLEGTAPNRDHASVPIAVEEVAPAGDEEDSGPAFAFSALLAGRVGGTTIWIEPRPSIWPAGAAAFGLDPASLVLVAAEGADSLRAAEEVLRCPAVGTCVLVGAIPDLAASRRLQLAAEAGGVLGIASVPERSLTAPLGSQDPVVDCGGPRHRLSRSRHWGSVLAARPDSRQGLQARHVGPALGCPSAPAAAPGAVWTTSLSSASEANGDMMPR